MEKVALNRMIGENLKKLREENHLSLDKLARLSGVSKPMLAQIERGASNPTVSTLWKIANGLGVSFSTFLEEEEPIVKKVDRKAIEPLKEETGKFHVIPLFTMEPGKSFEVFSVILDPGCDYQSNAHPNGVEEYILVEQGKMEIKIEQETYTLEVGQSIRFTAGFKHYYLNKTDEPCQVTMIIYYPPHKS
ncbi:helix-turn-helix domain-containing protein [Pseudalkalibacillus caeni]|uniref:Helix-turn-helix domain-containing protein n=1 Tax=Exobacillus caeni TaxID=2574798 RepID=A0A5R9FB53_9BACL|nr:XRE family transcriptional regulator [Pseudalkalibacillus caeni]TLS38113.1 helix-turn-helix domain-containing protein [Pseudalkalibacillus caeni]